MVDCCLTRVVERARIVLRAAAGEQDKGIAHDLGITPKKVSRWRNRYRTLGLAGLEKDALRLGRKPEIGARLIQRAVEMTTRHKPPNATHWSTRTPAAAVGISEASVRRIWRTHGLKPYLLQTFKVNRDPNFAEKLADIVGLYLNPEWDDDAVCRPQCCQRRGDGFVPGAPSTSRMAQVPAPD